MDLNAQNPGISGSIFPISQQNNNNNNNVVLPNLWMPLENLSGNPYNEYQLSGHLNANSIVNHPELPPTNGFIQESQIPSTTISLNESWNDQLENNNLWTNTYLS